MFQRKGQLSVETMIIWGIVILVAISVIGMLVYFDVLDLGSYLPDKCDLGGTGDLKCEEMKFSGTEIQLGIRNIGQKPIDTLTITADDEQEVHFTGTPSGSIISTLAPGDIVGVTIDVSGSGLAKPGQVLKGSLKTEYMYTGGAITQEASGSIRIKAS